MYVDRKKILSIGRDINLTIGLTTNDSFFDYEQENSRLINEIDDEIINEPVDIETRRLTYGLSSGTIRFEFHLNGSYNTNLTRLGFSNDDIMLGSNSLRNTFIIFDVYDGINQYTQNKLYSGYFTKFTRKNDAIFELSEKKCQFHAIELPLWFLDQQEDEMITLYARFSLYNAKTGKLLQFYNDMFTPNRTPDNLYIRIRLNLETRKWNFINLLGHTHMTPRLREFITSEKYSERINNTITNTEDRKQSYPDGITFNHDTADYTND